MTVTYQYFILLLVIISGITVCAEKNKMNITRIIGGYSVDKPIPYQVSLQVRTQRPMFTIPFLTENRDHAHICGGSIIGPQFVLTAAHCVDNANPKELTVVVGTVKRNGAGGTRYNVESYVTHPTYKPLVTGDVAVMKISKPFEMTRSVNTIELSDQFIDGNVPVKLSGWGYTRSITIGPLPETLQTIDLRTITNDQCMEEGFNVTKGEICTYKGILQGACAGDSGGPLVTDDRKTQVGIVSYGTSICSIGLPDAFTRVSTYLPWIKEQMAKMSKDTNENQEITDNVRFDPRNFKTSARA